MMAAGVHSEELDVRHVAQPREGMPVAVMGGGEGPVEAFFAPAGLHPTILGYIPRII